MILYAWLVGAWTAVLWFFTFGVARNLFAVFPRERAGEVTTALFPAYFIAVIGFGCLTTTVLLLQPRRKRDHWALFLQTLALFALVAIPIIVQPAIVRHEPRTPEWARWHGVSMALNLFSLIAVPSAGLLVLARRKE